MMKYLMSLFAVLAASLVLAADDDLQGFLKVSPLRGDISTTKTGKNNNLGRTNNRPQNSTKTTTSNMKWKCDVRFRGKTLPEKVEVRVYYIGYDANNMTPILLGNEKQSLTLDEGGKASVELKSPTVTLTKKRTTRSNGNNRNGRGGGGTKSETSGQRMGGCVVQLWNGDELVKSYSSVPTWEKPAKSKDFKVEMLDPRNRNGIKLK